MIALALAALAGLALGLAEATGSVAWPPVVAFVSACIALAVAVPSAAWGLGLVAGVAAAAADAMFGQGRLTLLHYGVDGPLGALWPALAGTHFGRFITSVAGRVRSRGLAR